MDWSKIRHFSREEWKNDPDRVLPDLVLLLDEQRDAHGLVTTGISYKIHVAYDESGHVVDSSHYAVTGEFATAVDYHMEMNGTPLSLLDQWLFAERFPWNGIGLYPFWTSPGLHCDLRKLGQDHPHLGKRWWRDKDGTYKSVDRAMLTLLLEREKTAANG